jgi:hypothetical protein
MPEGQLSPLPRLQTNEPASLEKFRAKEAKTLQSYGWVDETSRVARMPIDEAKKRILERGLPVRPGAPLDDRVGTHAAAMGGPSSGRTIKEQTP